MSRTCPHCKSVDVRRSVPPNADTSAQPVWRSCYRCRACGQQFWVISRRAYRIVGAFVAINLTFAVLVTVVVAVFGPH